MNEFRQVDAVKLRACVTDLFHSVGVPKEEAAIISDCLVEADLTGVDSHGITRIGVYVDHMEKGGFAKIHKIDVVQESESAIFLDANGALGFVSSKKAMELAIEKARKTGAAVAAIRNSNHYGAAAYFTKMAANENMIAFSCTNGQPAIAPWGGTEPYSGTNPFSISFPTKGDPVVLDMASSVVARGKVILAERKDAEIPLGWALDKQGHPTTNAKDAIAGSMFPFGGVKGYAIALAVDILSAVLTGSNSGTYIPEFTNGACSQNIGQFFIVIDIARFVGVEDFLNGMEQLKSDIKGTNKIEGVEKICLPGEPEFDKRQQRAREGIPVSTVVYDDLHRLCNKYNIPFDISKE